MNRSIKIAVRKRGRPKGATTRPPESGLNFDSYVRVRLARKLQILQKEERALQSLLVHLRSIKRQLHIERNRISIMEADRPLEEAASSVFELAPPLVRDLHEVEAIPESVRVDTQQDAREKSVTSELLYLNPPLHELDPIPIKSERHS